MGATRIGALETFLKGKERTHFINAFKSDEFSFSMVCSYILTKVTSFSGCTNLKIVEKIQNGEANDASQLPQIIGIFDQGLLVF